jgi:hypothetical protein
VHAKGGGRDAKIWIDPEVTIAESFGFNSRELAIILKTVITNWELVLRKWHEHFGDDRPF